MAKKRKAGVKPSGTGPSQDIDPTASKLNVRSWEDVADSEDEFHIHRDKILLDEEPSRKRQRLQAEQNAYLEPSDEEVLAAPDEDDSDLDEDDDDLEEDENDVEDYEEEVPVSGKAGSKTRGRRDSASSAEEGEEEEEEREEGWGSSKRDYYDADMLETEADALEEEQEALRLQKKQLQGMTEADYGFDENEWLDADKEEEQDDDRDGTVQEVLPDIDITDEMSPQERSKILSTRYPEFALLAKEFLALQPQHEDLVLAEAAAKAVLHHGGHTDPGVVPVASIKRSALGGYLAALSMYFAVLSSGSSTTKADTIAKPPAELRDHPIMETLISCRTLWDKVKDVPLPDPANLVEPDAPTTTVEDDESHAEDVVSTQEKPKKKRTTKAEKAAARARLEAEARRAEEAQRLEERLAKMDDRLLVKAGKASTLQQVTKNVDNDEASDFGEETSLTAEEAAEKASRRKGLRFYTSQIAQKANKREAAGRYAGGDDDIPHRERLKDRVARLNTEAEARGRKKNGGTDEKLGGDSDEEDTRVAHELRADGDEEYYQTIAGRSQAKKDAKAARAALEKEAKALGGRVVEQEITDASGKRSVGYTIEKNKGLTPKRSKDVRNPRVKKRKKYDEKMKKLGSIKAVYKGGEGRGGYKGELTGIKTGLVKSRKL